MIISDSRTAREAFLNKNKEVKMPEAKWERRADFVNMILFAAVTYDDVYMENVEFDGIAGEQFGMAIELAEEDSEQCNYYINLALKLNVPVEGLVADGEFGPKWDEVVGLCRAGD